MGLTGRPAAALPACRPEDWSCGEPLDPARAGALRTHLVLDACKWDPQVGDVATPAAFPLILPTSAGRDLARLAEALAAEADAAGAELLGRPDLLGRLGLPRALRRLLADRGAGPMTPAAARVVRFDFHPTAEGWRVSEANSDVPGGYGESGPLTARMAELYPGTTPAGDPGAALVRALSRCGEGPVALLAAPGYLEDQQVVAYLAGRLRAAGHGAVVAQPAHLRYTGERAFLEAAWYRGPVEAVFRFYQGEWLPGSRADWPRLLRGGRTPVCNPASGLTVESKRFPLVWDDLATALPTWRALLPETVGPRRLGRRLNSDWVLKRAYGNNGDDVYLPDLEGPAAWRRAAWAAWLRPGGWAAQRRFHPTAIPTPLGPRFPCLGVYTVDGRAAGVYGRLSPTLRTDYAAVDVAVLLRDDPAGEGTDGPASTL